MSDDIKRQIESGEADPSDFVNTHASARRKKVKTGTATPEDMAEGAVDPDHVLDGTTTIDSGSSSDAVHVSASDLQADDVQAAYAQQESVVVHLGPDEEVNQHAEAWADKHGAAVTETTANV